MNDTIPIFYASDNNYAKALSVSMASVLANTDSFIEFYILENKISENAKEKIELLKNHFNNFSIKYINVDMSIFDEFPNLNWYSLNMYSRFYIPEIERSLDKVIYLDVDIVLKRDILELFKIDLQDYPIGAVVGERKYLDAPYFIKHMQDLNLSQNHTYFGSGVLVINSKVWREQHYFEKLLDIVVSNKNNLKYPDQDALNILFDNNYKQIDLYWNRDIGCIIDEFEYDKNIVDKCFLIHYDGPLKPWNSNIFASEIFWEYAKYSAFEDELKQEKIQCINKFKQNIKKTKLYYYLYKITLPPLRKYFKNKYQKLQQTEIMYKTMENKH